VKGNVTGRNVVVGGSIQGNVGTTGRLEILSTGRVYGDIMVGSLIIDEGGILRGKSAVHADEGAVAAGSAVLVTEGATA
jgi:cytoskeletal protein CcmA (bactofilin family)